MMFRKIKLVFLLLSFTCLNVFAYSYDKNSEYIAFDLDETLISSDRLLNEDISTALRLGYDVKTSLSGQKYVVRPGAIELLDYAKSLGFKLMIFTNNRKSYAQDILASSKLNKYFDKVISNENVKQKVNQDFELYPYHRNKVHPQQKSKFKTYTSGFYNGFVKRSFQRLIGNKNIHPYIPKYYSSKYPPMYGARVLIDNAEYNVEEPLDFVGIKVPEFYALELEPRNADNSFVWVEDLKRDLLFLKKHDWVELYKLKYNKQPIDIDIPLQSFLKQSSKDFLNHATITFFGQGTTINNLNLSIS